MDGKADDDGQALASIARLLVALAGLAERASRRSLPLRCLILWVLRPAEARARNFIIAEALAVGDAVAYWAAPMPAGDSVAELARLAARFRALALAMRKAPGPAYRFARRSARRDTMLRRLALFVLAMPSPPTVAAVRPVDTS